MQPRLQPRLLKCLEKRYFCFVHVLHTADMSQDIRDPQCARIITIRWDVKFRYLHLGKWRSKWFLRSFRVFLPVTTERLHIHRRKPSYLTGLRGYLLPA